MPKFREILGFHVYVWSNEGDPIEPIHVHVSKKPSKNATKIWILRSGEVRLAFDNGELTAKELKQVQKLIAAYSSDFVEKWEEYFGVEARYIDD